jgi:hypothetical protein
MTRITWHAATPVTTVWSTLYRPWAYILAGFALPGARHALRPAVAFCRPRPAQWSPRSAAEDTRRICG